MSQPEIILFGAGGHCHACIDVIEAEQQFSIAGIIERPGANVNHTIYGYPILGNDDDMSSIRSRYSYALITVGQIRSASARIRLFQKLVEYKFHLPVIQSPRAYVSKHASVGAGTIIMHDALINAGASVGVNCIINTKTLIEHDTTIGDHCHISTGAIVNGQSRVGNSTFWGSNTVGVQGITIPENSFVQAGGLEKGKS